MTVTMARPDSSRTSTSTYEQIMSVSTQLINRITYKIKLFSSLARCNVLVHASMADAVRSNQPGMVVAKHKHVRS